MLPTILWDGFQQAWHTTCSSVVQLLSTSLVLSTTVLPSHADHKHFQYLEHAHHVLSYLPTFLQLCCIRSSYWCLKTQYYYPLFMIVSFVTLSLGKTKSDISCLTTRTSNCLCSLFLSIQLIFIEQVLYASPRLRHSEG